MFHPAIIASRAGRQSKAAHSMANYHSFRRSHSTARVELFRHQVLLEALVGASFWISTVHRDEIK